MSQPWFYAPDLHSGEQELAPEEAGHAAGARRLRAGEEVALFDGRGRVGYGALTGVSAKRVTVLIDRLEEQLPGVRLTVAVAVPKGKRLQMMIEKLTELGVSVIQPLRFARSVAEGGADPVNKWGRWTIEAAKQCRRARLPEILPLLDFSAYAAQMMKNNASSVFLADAEGVSPAALLADVADPVCLIGPEGGLSPEEFALCAAAGWQRLRLGCHVLRIETAALAFCSAAFAVQQQ